MNSRDLILSIDLILKRKTVGTRVGSPRLDVQIKSTADDCIGTGEVTFDLPIKNYEELRDINLFGPSYFDCRGYATKH
jgi:hypothetical protein